MAFTSAFFTSSFGTVTVSKPFSRLALTSSIFAFSGNLNRRRNLPLLLSTRCHLSFFYSCSVLLSPLICSTLPSSTSTFTSSFFNPGRSALKTWASGVSFQSMRALVKAEVSRVEEGTLARGVVKGNPSKGSQMSREKGSKMLLRRPLPRTLEMSDIFELIG